MQDLKVALVQSHLHWEKPADNRKMFEDKLEDMQTPADIFLLPEMFTTGFTMEPKGLAENMSGETVAWLQKIANLKNAVVTGSIIIEENGAYYNRLIWMQPDGQVQWYNKKHLFSMAGEEKVYFPGSEKLLVTWKGWKICPMICYDLRFPVWVRNVEDYDLLLFAANWPERRIMHWRKLLQARAIENQCFVIGVNRVGLDGKGINHTGNSMAVDPMGEILLEIENQDAIAIASLDQDELVRARRYMPFLKDRDSFELK
jgi:omega-amidase